MQMPPGSAMPQDGPQYLHRRQNVMRLNSHIADIDADTETKAPVFSVADCKFMSTGLE
jgi:hypothetical protein